MTDCHTLDLPNVPPVGLTPSHAITLSTHTMEFGDGVAVVAARGEVDLATAPLLGAALTLAANDPAIRLLVCDLSEVGFLSCAGVGMLVDVRVLLAGRGSALRVVTRNSTVLRVLAVTDLLDILGVCGDRAAALATDRLGPGGATSAGLGGRADLEDELAPGAL